MKDHCPQCGMKFGFSGPTPEVTADNQLVYHCPRCRAVLKRDTPLWERMISIVGYMTLLTALTISVIESVNGSIILNRQSHLALYVTSVVCMGLSIVFSLTRQHYSVLKSSGPV